jgi:hypothetical protein
MFAIYLMQKYLGAGKTENCRMIIKFLSKISGKFLPLQRSSNSMASYKSSSNSTTSTPKHKTSVTTSTSVFQNEKSSCFKSDSNRNKKVSRVEFQICSEQDVSKFCPKHSCNQILSSVLSNTSNAIEIPKQKPSTHLKDFSKGPSKSFTIYETLNRTHNTKEEQMQLKRESLYFRNNEISNDVVTSYSLDEKVLQNNVKKSLQNNSQLSYDKNNINLNNFKISARKTVFIQNVSKFSNLCSEKQTMKERIAQAETFLEAMGGASMVQNRDSSRYVRISFKRLFSD